MKDIPSRFEALSQQQNVLQSSFADLKKDDLSQVKTNISNLSTQVLSWTICDLHVKYLRDFFHFYQRWDGYPPTTRFWPGITLPVITMTRPGITLKMAASWEFVTIFATFKFPTITVPHAVKHTVVIHLSCDRF